MDVSCFLLCICFLIVTMVSFSEDHNTDYYVACYSSITKDWSTHESYCQSTFGTHLASMYSTGDQQQAYTLITAMGFDTVPVVMGANDIDIEGTWVWTDGNTLNSYDFWKNDEPNDGTATNCGQFRRGGRWEAEDCTLSQSCFMCNMPPIISTTEWKIYNITITIGNDASTGIFYLRINGTDTNSFTEWYEFSEFSEISSSYSMFPNLTNVGDCQEIQILTEQSDGIIIDGVYCNNKYIITTNTLVEYIGIGCNYLLINYNTNTFEDIIDDNGICSSPTLPPTDITQSPTTAPSLSPTSFPVANPSINPTTSPTSIPTDIPSIRPINSPSQVPTTSPSIPPTRVPFASPTTGPSTAPTMFPTHVPTNIPTAPYSVSPTIDPTNAPSEIPTAVPTNSPSIYPTQTPSIPPSNMPSGAPTLPTTSPSIAPSISPSNMPSAAPTPPTSSPSSAPTILPTMVPTNIPTLPTVSPSNSPSQPPTIIPTNTPVQPPTIAPSNVPSSIPSSTPTIIPSNIPSQSPTNNLETGNVGSNNSGNNKSNTPSFHDIYNKTVVPIMVGIALLIFCITIIYVHCKRRKRQHNEYVERNKRITEMTGMNVVRSRTATPRQGSFEKPYKDAEYEDGNTYKIQVFDTTKVNNRISIVNEDYTKFMTHSVKNDQVLRNNPLAKVKPFDTNDFFADPQSDDEEDSLYDQLDEMDEPNRRPTLDLTSKTSEELTNSPKLPM